MLPQGCCEALLGAFTQAWTLQPASCHRSCVSASQARSRTQNPLPQLGKLYLYNIIYKYAFVGPFSIKNGYITGWVVLVAVGDTGRPVTPVEQVMPLL